MPCIFLPEADTVRKDLHVWGLEPPVHPKMCQEKSKIKGVVMWTGSSIGEYVFLNGQSRNGRAYDSPMG